MRFQGSIKLTWMVVMTAGAALLLAACASTPKWVEKGGGYMNEKNSKAFYGVGGVSGVKNEPLAREAADNRARADLAKRQAPHLQSEGDALGHGHVGEEGIVLKDHSDVAVFRRHVGNFAVTDHDAAFVHLF